MSEKIYYHLLLFCGILCQGIFATFSHEDNRVSSDFLVRKRRVISLLPDGRDLTRIDEVRYIVKIKENGRPVCAGAILSHYTVITAATCIQRRLQDYKIHSGGSYDQRSNVHSVESKTQYYGNPPHKSIDGIVLLTVDPPFLFSRNTGYIELYEGPLPAHTIVTVSGWGYLYPLQPGPNGRPRLHSITLPIMNHEECQTVYRDNSNRVNLRNAVAVTDKHICTYCVLQYCARNDVGAPLVFDNKLAAIHTYKGEYEGHRNPDVYINLQRPEYTHWIREKTLLI